MYCTTIIHIYSVETQVVFAHDTNSFGTSTHILEGRALPQGRGSGATEQVISGGKWGPVPSPNSIMSGTSSLEAYRRLITNSLTHLLKHQHFLLCHILIFLSSTRSRRNSASICFRRETGRVPAWAHFASSCAQMLRRMTFCTCWHTSQRFGTGSCSSSSQASEEPDREQKTTPTSST